METVWTGPDALREYLVPVTDVVIHPRNPRRGKVALIAESLRRFGQVRPILINDETREVVAGNHTTLAARDLGWTHVAAVRQRFASADDARDYLLADNRLAELGDYDREQLLVMLGEVESADSWEGTGYTIDDLDDLRALHGEVPTMAPAPFTGGFALSDDALAARAAQLAAGRRFDEIGLLFTADGYDQFESDLRVLRKEYGADGGVTDLVFRAAADEAFRLNQG